MPKSWRTQENRRKKSESEITENDDIKKSGQDIANLSKEKCPNLGHPANDIRRNEHIKFFIVNKQLLYMT